MATVDGAQGADGAVAAGSFAPLPATEDDREGDAAPPTVALSPSVTLSPSKTTTPSQDDTTPPKTTTGGDEGEVVALLSPSGNGVPTPPLGPNGFTHAFSTGDSQRCNRCGGQGWWHDGPWGDRCLACDPPLAPWPRTC